MKCNNDLCTDKNVKTIILISRQVSPRNSYSVFILRALLLFPKSYPAASMLPVFIKSVPVHKTYKTCSSVQGWTDVYSPLYTIGVLNCDLYNVLFLCYVLTPISIYKSHNETYINPSDVSLPFKFK